MNAQDLVLMTLRSRIVKKLPAESQKDLDLVIFSTRLNENNRITMVETRATTKKGEQFKLDFEKKKKPKKTKEDSKSFHDQLLGKLRDKVLEKLDEDFIMNLDLMIFKSRISPKGKLKIVGITCTDTSGNAQDVEIDLTL